MGEDGFIRMRCSYSLFFFLNLLLYVYIYIYVCRYMRMHIYILYTVFTNVMNDFVRRILTSKTRGALLFEMCF